MYLTARSTGIIPMSWDKDNGIYSDCMTLVIPSVLAFWFGMLDGYDTETSKARGGGQRKPLRIDDTRTASCCGSYS